MCIKRSLQQDGVAEIQLDSCVGLVLMDFLQPYANTCLIYIIVLSQFFDISVNMY